MKVLFDGRILGPKISGVERYLLELLRQFAAPDFQPSGRVSVLLEKGSGAEGIAVPRVVLDEGGARLDDYDLFHRGFQVDDFHTVIELAAARASVLTVHDLIAYHYPNYWDDEARFHAYRRNLALGLAVADRVIAVSEASKSDLLSTFPIREEKIRVVHNGVDRRFSVIEDRAMREAFLARYGLKEGYLLTIGTSDPHKNRIGLLRAFARMLEAEPDAQLVLAGRSSLQPQPELETLVRSLRPRVIDLGAVPDEDLVLLYNNARIFVFPSLYEGFGLPLLEAFACGVATICSRHSSLPEVAGDAALQVDATQVEDLSAAMIALYRDSGKREELRARGFERVKQFGWERCAGKTWEVYQDAINEVSARVAGIAERIRSSAVASALEPKREGDRPKSFTIAICTRNRARRLRATLASIGRLERTGIDFCELLIVDNGSTDETRETVELAKGALGIETRYIFEGEAGLSRARNRAIREAQGEIVVFLDDDVEIPPDLLQQYASAYARWPEASCIGGKVELKWISKRPRWMTEELSALLGKTICADEERAYRGPVYYIIGCNMSFRRSVFDRVGLFNTELGYRGRILTGNEENDILRRIDRSGGVIVFSHHPRLYHLIEDDKLTRRYFLRRYYYQGVSDAHLVNGDDAKRNDRAQRRRLALRALIRMFSGRDWMTDLSWAFYHSGRMKTVPGGAPVREESDGAMLVDEQKLLQILQPAARELNDRALVDEDLRQAVKEIARELVGKQEQLRSLTSGRAWRLISAYYRLAGGIRWFLAGGRKRD